MTVIPPTPPGPLALDRPRDSSWVDRETFELILAVIRPWAISEAAQFGVPATRGHRAMPGRWRRPT